MKITKMSLVAALLVGSSAFAIENTKVSGDAKVFYATDDAAGTSHLGNTKSGTLFHKTNSAAQAAASLSISSDLTDGISAGSKMTALTTLGLENQLVENVWELTNGTSDSFIVNELWLAGTAGKTTAKIGRMELDTPLVFSEKWSIVANTYEAAVLINTDIPDTTLVGAYVGASNIAAGNGYGGVIATQGAKDTTFSQFGPRGAYAIGAINNSWAPLTAQAWYYDVTSYATAYWLQADLNMEGILVGAQYTGGTVGSGDASGTFAVMAGYEMKDTVTAKIAYSQTADKGALHGGNVSGTQSKLYTEAWWNYGQITQVDTSAINLTVESPVNGIVDLGLYVTMVDHGDTNTAGDLMETTLTAGKSFGPLDTTLAVIYADTDAADTTGSVDPDAVTSIQAYLTYNF